MKQLIAKVRVVDGYGNEKTLKIFTNRDEGVVHYSLVSDSDTSFSIGNMQCGWKGPALPDNTYEYDTNTKLLDRVLEAVRGGVYRVLDKKLFVK